MATQFSDATIADFCSQTGADAVVARSLLQESDWDLISALKAYSHWAPPNGETMRNGSLPNAATVGGSDAPRRASNGVTPAALRKQPNNCYYHIETPSYTFTLPNLASLPPDFRKFLERDLFETCTLRGLENSGHLNWWTANGVAQKLWPLATSGDGNCLLHAASLGMWGFHDRLLILRNALHLILTKGSRRHALWRRWRWQQTQINRQTGLDLSEEQWADEWQSILRLASARPRSKPASSEPIDAAVSDAPVSNPESPSDANDGEIVYESLEDVHVFALAHVLKRPIVVVADTVLRDSVGEAFAPIPFGGIYLPLECAPAECHRSPLVLCYDAAHFSALVAMQPASKTDGDLAASRAVIPITDKCRMLLPVHFACDPGADFTWWQDDADEKIARCSAVDDERRLVLICRYMDVARIPLRRSSTLSRKEQSASLQRPPRRSGSLTNIAEATHHRKMSLNDLTKTILRKLHLTRNRQRSSARGRRSERGEPAAQRSRTLPRGTGAAARSGERPPISLEDALNVNYLVAAQLRTESHQYMQEMVQNYLRSARLRFDAEQRRPPGAVNRPSAPRRERISRSFSTSSLVVSCMNGDCDQPASHATNFLCDACFRTQTQLMASFSNGAPASPGAVAAAVVKARTLPALSGGATPSASASSVTVRQPRAADAIETRYGVSAVTNPHGVTHYFLPDETQFCRSPHCGNYSNGHATLCCNCAKLVDAHVSKPA